MFVLNAGDTIQGGADVATTITYSINGMTFSGGVQSHDMLAQGQLAASPAALYTCPASTQAFVLSIHIVNTNTAVRTFQLFLNGTAASNAITPVFTLRPEQSATYTEHGGWKFSNQGLENVLGMVGSLIRVTDIFNGTVQYTPSVGCKSMLVEGVGAGAGGGGNTDAVTNSAGGGGGGAGAYSAVFVTSILANYVVAVGAGGAGGAAGSNGTVGGDTTFGSILTAKGGSGGINDTVAAIHVGGLGGAGGLASSGVGDIKCDGASGRVGLAIAAAQALGGAGGSSVFCGGAANARKTEGVGAAATNYGSGGAGGVELSGATARAGGAGSNGLIRVWEFA